MIKCKYQIKGGMPMNQMPLTDMEYSNPKKKNKREEFLDAMADFTYPITNPKRKSQQ